LRTVYLGTSEFAATVLAHLAEGPHRPALVITRPDRPSGRGRKLAAPPVAEAAQRLGLALAQPERVNEPDALATIEQVAQPAAATTAAATTTTAASATTTGLILIVCAFGALIKEPLLSAYSPLNVHPSLLPRWRGAAPIERAIMAGDERTGVSIMRLTAGLDSGPVCLAAAEAIDPQDTYGTLAARLARLGGELLVRVLDEWEGGQPPPFVEQEEAHASYAEKLGPADRLLDPQRSAAQLERVVRALQPHIGARLALADGTALGVHRARALAQAQEQEQEQEQELPPPGVIAEAGGRLLYGTRAGALELLEVQPPGGRPMDATAYLRGHKLSST
jgi:methionyl-tRNA formyltransferase